MSINRISLYHLETLVWIARLGSFAAAADHMNTTQPAISARIKELEDRLGATLFQKHGRGVELTPAGRELVRDYVPLWEKLQQTLIRSAGFDQLQGVVRIGAGEIAAATCLPSFIRETRKRWPKLTFEIEIELTSQLVHGLLSGRLDIAFAAGPIAHPGLAATPVGAAELIWVASPTVVKELESNGERVSTTLWSLPNHSPIHQIIRQEMQNLPAADRSINLCNNVRTMIDIVVTGDGFALAPASMVQEHLASGTLVQLPQANRVEPIMFHAVARSAEGDPVIKEVLKYAKQVKFGRRGQNPTGYD